MLLYNGQLDLIIGPPLTENFLEVLDWSGHGDYLASPKTLWKVDGKIAGYVRTVHNFMQVRAQLMQQWIYRGFGCGSRLSYIL